MGWLLGCFKCRQRRRAGSSINLSTNCKAQTGASASAGLLSSCSAQGKGNLSNDVSSDLRAERFELERFLTLQDSELEKNSSAICKTDWKCCSARKHSSEQLLQVEKLEEEINNLNRKLVEEASQATNLSNKVRHLRNCSALLDSPNAFKNALDALARASEEGQLEESQPLLYLQSLLSKIDSSEAVVEPSSEERDETGAPKGSKILLEECLNLSSMTEKEQNFPYGKAIVIEHDQSQQQRINSDAVTISRVFDEEPGLQLKDDQNVCNSRHQCSFDDGVNMDTKQPQLISVIKRRRSSTTLSFSGFLLMEDATEGRNISEQVAIEQFSRTEFSITNIIEKPDMSSENLVDSSKSLFAFATDCSQSRSILTDSSLFENVSKEFSSPSSESEKPNSNDSIFNLHYRSPRCLWSPQDVNTSESHRECSILPMEQSQVDTNESSYDGFSGTLSLTSTSSSSKTDHNSARSLDIEDTDFLHDTYASSSKVPLQMHIPSVEDEGSTKRSANSYAPVTAPRASQQEDVSDVVTRNSCSSDCYSLTEVQEDMSDVLTRTSCSLDCYSTSESWPRSMDSSVSPCQQNLVYADSLEAGIAQVVDSEAKHGRKSSISEGQMSIKSLERSNQEEAILAEKPLISNQAALNLAENLDRSTANKELTPQHTLHLTSLRLVQDDISMVGGKASVELSTPGATSVWSSHTEVSPTAIDTFSPLPSIRKRVSSDGLSQTPLTPISVNSILPLSNDGTNKPQCTPLRTPLASLSQVETPYSVHCQGSPTSLDEDRPILGTVAAHWNHSSSSKQKWWDGKGIPNSTNKYKEDQKVSWHATPFEVRLERALAKQGRVFQKKLFTGAWLQRWK